MQRYAKHAPTAFDVSGAFLPDRQDWYVLPVSQTRDSGPLDKSNFETAQKILADGRDAENDGEGPADFEVHRFGHWGPGWYEIIIIAPDSEAFRRAEGIEERMENYPVLDESDYSSREWDEFSEGWESWGCKGLVSEVVRVFGLSDRSEEVLQDADREVLRQWWMDNASEPYFSESDGVCIPVRRHVEGMDRADCAALLKLARKPVAPVAPVEDAD